MKRNENPTEYHECVALSNWLVCSGIDFFTHINNEMWTPGWGQKIKSKAMHVSKGVPDYMIVVPAGRAKEGEAILLFVEMKRIGAGKGAIKKEQYDWKDELNEITNVQAEICFGSKEAIEFVKTYLKLDDRVAIYNW